MDRISRDRTTVVCPVIDIINDDTLEYTFNNAHLSVGGFDWGLQVDKRANLLFRLAVKSSKSDFLFEEISVQSCFPVCC